MFLKVTFKKCSFFKKIDEKNLNSTVAMNSKENQINANHKNAIPELKNNKISNRANKNLPEETKKIAKTVKPTVQTEEKANFVYFEDKNIRNYKTPAEKEEEDLIVRNILNLRDYQKREEALKELSVKREKCSYLATYLWFSFGTSAILYLKFIL